MFSKKSIKPKILKRPKIKNIPLAGIRGKLELTKEDQQDVEIFDPEDVDEFESDFMNVHKSYEIHKRYVL